MHADPVTPNPPTTDAVQDDAVALAGAAGALPCNVELNGVKFHVRPMKVAQVFPFLALARPLFGALARKPSSPPSALPPAGAGPGQGAVLPVDVDAALSDADWLVGLLTDHGPTIVRALAVGLERDQAKVDAMVAHLEDLDVVDLVVLVKHFVTVNAGFFAARGLTLPPLSFPSPSPASAGDGAASVPPPR